MFKQFALGDLVFFVVLGVAAAAFFLPIFTADALPRLNAASTILLTGALVWVTHRYTLATDKMAKTSANQAEVMNNQLDLEYEPNLLLTVETIHADEAMYRLVNLGRYPVWIISVETTIARGARSLLRPDTQVRRRRQHGLLPGESVEVVPFPPVERSEPDSSGNPTRMVRNPGLQTDVSVAFHYGSTGPLHHEITWTITRHRDQPGFATVVYKGPPPPFPVRAIWRRSPHSGS